MADTCIFCKITKKEIPARVVFEDASILAFEDLHPQAPLHVLIIPKRHIAMTSDLRGSDVEIVGRMMLAAKEIAVANGFGASGYRIVLNCNRDAGQEVFHLHLHLLGGRKFDWPPG